MVSTIPPFQIFNLLNTFYKTTKLFPGLFGIAGRCLTAKSTLLILLNFFSLLIKIPVAAESFTTQNHHRLYPNKKANNPSIHVLLILYAATKLPSLLPITTISHIGFTLFPFNNRINGLKFFHNFLILLLIQLAVIFIK